MPTNSYELKHYGILGMHWGVRKAEARSYREQGYANKHRRIRNFVRGDGTNTTRNAIANAYDKSAASHQKAAHAHKSWATKLKNFNDVFGEPYKPSKKQIITFEKAAAITAGVLVSATAAAVISPATGLLKNKIAAYLVYRTGPEYAAKKLLGG